MHIGSLLLVELAWVYFNSVPVVNVFYTSSAYKDELLWAATWLYHATQENFFLSYHQRVQATILQSLQDNQIDAHDKIIDVMKLEFEDDGNFVRRAENISRSHETFYRDLIFLRLGKIVERVKEQNKSVEELHLTGLKEQEALRKLQSIDELLMIIQEEIRDKEFRDAESLNKLQEVEAIVKIQVVDFQKKAQILQEDTKKILQEEAALKKSQEKEALENLREEGTQKNDKKQKSTRKHKKRKH